MIFCREGIRYFEDLMKERGLQVFNDACDFGAFITDKELGEARLAIRQFMDEGESYKMESCGKGYSITFQVPIEDDEGWTWGYRVSIYTCPAQSMGPKASLTRIARDYVENRFNENFVQYISFNIQHTNLYPSHR
jgi:hypothetical protein